MKIDTKLEKLNLKKIRTKFFSDFLITLVYMKYDFLLKFYFGVLLFLCLTSSFLSLSLSLSLSPTLYV